MVKLLSITESPNPKKKWRAVFLMDNVGRHKTVDFGAKGMNDYTLTGDKDARARYRNRHLKDLETAHNRIGIGAGALSYYILWGDSPSRIQNIAAYKKRFNM